MVAQVNAATLIVTTKSPYIARVTDAAADRRHSRHLGCEERRHRKKPTPWFPTTVRE